MSTYNVPPTIRSLASEIAALAAVRGVDVYAVGGTVRDAIIGRAMHDLDITVSQDALGFARALADALGGHFVELDDEQAIARVVLDGRAVSYVDVAELQGSLDADLRRRDFTINALAAPIEGGEVVDATGGVADIDVRVVRMISAGALDEDPLRALRGARLASEMGFMIEPTTLAAIRARAPLVRRAAAERCRDELARVFALPAAYGAVVLLDECGLLEALLPEVTFGRDVTQASDFHAYDVLRHSLHAVEAVDMLLVERGSIGEASWLADAFWEAFGWCEGDLRIHFADELSGGRTRGALLKLAALLHDVAKPQTRTVEDDGRVRFLGHAEEGGTIAARVMRRLRFSAAEVRYVSRLVAEHLRPVQLAQIGEAPTRRALYRFYRDLGDAVPGVLVLSLADAAAARGPQMTSADWTRHVRYMNSLLVRSYGDEGILDPPRLLTGDDIMSRFGLKEGPIVGRVLSALREAQGAGEVTDRARAWDFVAAQIVEEEQAEP